MQNISENYFCVKSIILKCINSVISIDIWNEMLHLEIAYNLKICNSIAVNTKKCKIFTLFWILLDRLYGMHPVLSCERYNII
jgi:hypothetical protein